MMKNMRKSLSQVIVCLRKIQRSLSCNFSSRTPWSIASRKARSHRGTPAENHIISWASLLKRPICITHRHSGKDFSSRLSTLVIRSHWLHQRSSVGVLSLKPFNSHKWPRHNFSFKYQYNINQISDENKENCQFGDN